MQHYEINRIVDNTPWNEQQIQEYCSEQQQDRIYSQWYRIQGVHRLLMMLGFTLKFCEGTNGDTGYLIKHWYGQPAYADNAINLINTLQGE